MPICFDPAPLPCRSAVATNAESYRPNSTGSVEFRPTDWIAERVMASDPRELEIVLLHHAEGDGHMGHSHIQDDPSFLGVARIRLAQCWELLSFADAEVTRRLRVKLGPREHPKATGTAIVRITVRRARRMHCRHARVAVLPALWSHCGAGSAAPSACTGVQSRVLTSASPAEYWQQHNMRLQCCRWRERSTIQGYNSWSLSDSCAC